MRDLAQCLPYPNGSPEMLDLARVVVAESLHNMPLSLLKGGDSSQLVLLGAVIALVYRERRADQPACSLFSE
jgi:hypothetical protein